MDRSGSGKHPSSYSAMLELTGGMETEAMDSCWVVWYGGFLGVPQNGRFIVENPNRKWMIWGVAPFMETPISCSWESGADDPDDPGRMVNTQDTLVALLRRKVGVGVFRSFLAPCEVKTGHNSNPWLYPWFSILFTILFLMKRVIDWGIAGHSFPSALKRNRWVWSFSTTVTFRRFYSILKVRLWENNSKTMTVVLPLCTHDIHVQLYLHITCTYIYIFTCMYVRTYVRTYVRR